MQHLPVDVLQTFQHQGKKSEEGGSTEGRRSREEDRRRRTRTRDRSETYETSLSFTSSNSSRSAPSPPPSPFPEDASRHSRHARTEVRPGGSGGAREDAVATPSSLDIEARLRPAAGPRALAAPSRSPATETLSSQLLGGRDQAHADNGIVGPGPRHSAILPQEPALLTGYRSRPLLTRNASSWQGTETSPLHINIEQPPPLMTPASTRSSMAFTISSSSTPESRASSYAYMLRDYRVDKRLFKKKSKPSQHLQQSPNLVQQPSRPSRSASYYKPKVVEDTAGLKLSEPTPANRSSPSPLLKSPFSAPHVLSRAPNQKIRSSASQTDSTSPLLSPAMSPAMSPAIPKRDTAAFGSRHRRVHSKTSSGSHSRSKDFERYRLHHLQSSSSPDSNADGRPGYKGGTPPEGEPGTPYETTNAHGDHYFRTFGTDTIYQKKPSITTSPARRPGQESMAAPTPPQSRPLLPKIPSDPVATARTNRKRSSIFNLFKPTATGSRALVTPESDSVPMSPLMERQTPEVTISAPALVKDERRVGMDSYFTPPHAQNASPALTPGSKMSAKSPLSTHWEDVAAGGRPSGHRKEISDPLSPLSLPTHTTRPQIGRLKRSEKVLGNIRQLPEECVIPVVPAGAITGPQSTYEATDGKKYYKTSLTGPYAPDFQASERKRTNTPPLSKKPSGFKGFFFDLRSVPAERIAEEAESPEPAAMKRRAPIVEKGSLQSLLPKLSMPKLKRKAPQTVKEEPRIAPDPLEVTAFEQTSFSQRYGDTRRAKKSQIRSYLDEVLKEDDDESGIAPFELNIPEHLPNSPLCPLSPKHKSGGRAICPTHGRKKTSLASASRSGSKNQRQEPKIVFDSGLQDGDRNNGGTQGYRRTSRGSRGSKGSKGS